MSAPKRFARRRERQNEQRPRAKRAPGRNRLGLLIALEPIVIDRSTDSRRLRRMASMTGDGESAVSVCAASDSSAGVSSLRWRVLGEAT